MHLPDRQSAGAPSRFRRRGARLRPWRSYHLRQESGRTNHSVAIAAAAPVKMPPSTRYNNKNSHQESAAVIAETLQNLGDVELILSWILLPWRTDTSGDWYRATACSKRHHICRIYKFRRSDGDEWIWNAGGSERGSAKTLILAMADADRASTTLNFAILQKD